MTKKKMAPRKAAQAASADDGAGASKDIPIELQTPAPETQKGMAENDLGGEETVPAGSAVAPVMDERLLRLQADFENYKRRVLREKDELYRRASADLMTELIPVLDHLDMAFAAVGDRAGDPVVDGFRIVGEQLLAVLMQFGLKPIDAQDAPFDPNLHEAISHVPSPDVAADHVMAQTRRGYLLGERLLRASQVVVSSGPPEGSA